MPGISKNFTDWLKRYDPRLRAGWSNKFHCFVIWDKDIKGDKYVVIKSHYLDERVKEWIIERDLHRCGGAMNYLKTVEENERIAEEQLDKDHIASREAFLGEAYDHMNVVQGSRVFQ